MCLCISFSVSFCWICEDSWYKKGFQATQLSSDFKLLEIVVYDGAAYNILQCLAFGISSTLTTKIINLLLLKQEILLSSTFAWFLCLINLMVCSHRNISKCCSNKSLNCNFKMLHTHIAFEHYEHWIRKTIYWYAFKMCCSLWKQQWNFKESKKREQQFRVFFLSKTLVLSESNVHVYNR